MHDGNCITLLLFLFLFFLFFCFFVFVFFPRTELCAVCALLDASLQRKKVVSVFDEVVNETRERLRGCTCRRKRSDMMMHADINAIGDPMEQIRLEIGCNIAPLVVKLDHS